MSTTMRIVLTLVILALWMFFLLPFAVAGILSTAGFVLVIVATVAGIAALWVPRHRREQPQKTS